MTEYEIMLVALEGARKALRKAGVFESAAVDVGETGSVYTGDILAMHGEGDDFRAFTLNITATDVTGD